MIHIGDIIAFTSNARLLGPEYWGKKLKVLRIAPDGSLDIEILEEITRGTQLVHFMGERYARQPQKLFEEIKSSRYDRFTSNTPGDFPYREPFEPNDIY